MTELYSNEINFIEHQVRVRGIPTQPSSFSVTTEEGIVPEVNNIDNGKYEIIFQQSDLIGLKEVNVVYDYELAPHGTWSQKTRFPVASRIMTLDELNAWAAPNPEFSYEDYSRLEQFARNIIETYCDQSFSYWAGMREALGQEGIIQLDEHMESLQSVYRRNNLVEDTSYSELSNYYLGESGYAIYDRSRMRANASPKHRNSRSQIFSVTGEWGWKETPMAVKQAAFEIIGNFNCADIVYRRKFIDNMRSADTRIEFNEQAYGDTTGNPIADQLLEPYRQIYLGVL